MPSGKTHDRLTFLAAIPTGLAVHALIGAWSPALYAAGGMLFGGLMFGPDLDVKSVQYYRWGPLRWIWWPYQRLFRHRSTWTHGLAWGLLVRLVYLAVVTAGLGAVAFALIHTYVTPVAWPVETRAMIATLGRLESRDVTWALAGTWAGGALHTAADVTVSAFKRRRRPARARR